VAGSTLGIFTVPAGAVDSFLTSDKSKPVRTQVPFSAVAGFTGPSRTFTVAPIGAIVLSNWLAAQRVEGTKPTAPTANDFRAAYEKLAGPLPVADYFARDFKAGSASALAVYACDILLPTIPSLGGNFIASALNADVTKVVGVALGTQSHGVLVLISERCTGLCISNSPALTDCPSYR
jgi:hypothetical protein